MPLVFFMAPSDPRMLSTVDAIRKQVGAGGLAADGLVYRYDPAAAPDGLPGREGTFNMCSFWLVQPSRAPAAPTPRAWTTLDCSSSKCPAMPILPVPTR